MTDAMMHKRAEKMEVEFDQAISSFLENERPHLELQRRGKSARRWPAVITFLWLSASLALWGSN